MQLKGLGASTVGAPSKPTVAAAGSTALNVSWPAASGAAFYKVGYKPAAGSGAVQYTGRVTGTSAQLTGLAPGTAYNVFVTPFDAAAAAGASSLGATGTTAASGAVATTAPASTSTSNNNMLMWALVAVGGWFLLKGKRSR